MAATIRILGVSGLLMTALGVAAPSLDSAAIGFLLLLAFAVAGAVEMFTALQDPDRSRRLWDQHTCPWCQYDLSHLSGERCPECGAVRPGRGKAREVKDASVE